MQERAKHDPEQPTPIDATTDLAKIGLTGVELWLQDNKEIALETTANAQSQLWHNLSATVSLVKSLPPAQRATFNWSGNVSEVNARAQAEMEIAKKNLRLSKRGASGI